MTVTPLFQEPPYDFTNDMIMARKAISRAYCKIEQEFNCIDGLEGHLAQTGEPYVQITVSGIHSEESFISGFTSSIDSACAALLSHVYKHAEGKGKTLYWRITPEIEGFTLYREASSINDKPYPYFKAIPVWKVYTRLLVSDKPVIYRSLFEYPDDEKPRESALMKDSWYEKTLGIKLNVSA